VNRSGTIRTQERVDQNCGTDSLSRRSIDKVRSNEELFIALRSSDGTTNSRPARNDA